MTRLVASSLLLASCLVGSEAFVPSHGITSTVASVRSQSTLNALFSSDDDQTGESDGDLSRRDVGSRIAVLASAFATTFTSTDAFAEEEGRLIKFEVQNLDGGDSGSFTVRTRLGSEGSPKIRGTDREQVLGWMPGVPSTSRFHCAIWNQWGPAGSVQVARVGESNQ